jgi:hypothetical protein
MKEVQDGSLYDKLRSTKNLRLKEKRVREVWVKPVTDQLEEPSEAFCED